MVSTLQKIALIFAFCIFIYMPLHAQDEPASEPQNPTGEEYEVVIDEPYNINNLWIHFQPVYVDVFHGSLNVGFGLMAEYQVTDKLQLQASFRRSYGEKFDLTRSRGANNNDFDNKLRAFHFLQGFVAYSLYDDEREMKTRIILSNKELEPWEIENARATVVRSMVREVIALRGGAYRMQTSVDAKDALAAQSQDFSMFKGVEGANDLGAFTSFVTHGIFLGGSYTQIRNVAIRGPQQLKESASSVLINDGILTLFADLMYSPSQNIDRLTGNQNVSHDLNNIGFNSVGWRIGADMKYNREFFWSYGAEIGSHTAIDKRSGYVLVKLGFPVVSRRIEKTFN